MDEKIVQSRKKLDELDRELVEVIKKRFVISKDLGKYKLENGLKLRDRKREKEIISDRIEKSSLSSSFVKRLFKLILNESRRVQKND